MLQSSTGGGYLRNIERTDMNRSFFRVTALLLVMVFAAAPLTGCALFTNNKEGNMNDKLIATIEVEGYGSIVLELYPDKAPQTVRNFCSLARLHRISLRGAGSPGKTRQENSSWLMSISIKSPPGKRIT